MTMAPLLAHASLDAVVAWRPDGPVPVRRFLAEAAALAELLPPARNLLNACNDRYRFAVGFAAGLLRGMTSLQPSSQSAETLRDIQAAMPDVCCLCDGGFDSVDLPRLDFPDLAAVDPGKVSEIPAIPADHVAACLFTSGSTGLPMPHAKTWGKLVSSGQAEAARLGLAVQPHAIVGTVPVQHSYGFESTFLQALHGGSSFWSGKPFYPLDIVAALAAVPRPRLLVTTPFHLAALLAAGIDLPPVDLVLSATAPLSAELAGEAERCFGVPLHEIYGSTESGQVANRRTTAGAAWELFPGIRLTQRDETMVASGGHVEGDVPLADVIELLPDGRFLLHGRHADVVNIAGRRTSLAYLNHQIGAVPGVVDAAFFLPDGDNADGITRLCAFAVAPGLDSRWLLAELRRRVDPIFLPRPLVLVDALPRNGTGKLPRARLAALYAERVTHGSR
jgi:acyl-coenzyme A synthetase/AMP-(fatty) acid ligase